MQKRKLIVLAILLSLAQVTMAQAISSDTVLDLIKSGMAPAVSRLTSTAISWLGVFAVIQFVITNYGLLKSDADIQTVIAKAAASVTWIGVCLYIINNGPDFIQAVGDDMMGIVGFNLPSASGVIEQTVKISGVLAGVAVAASATPFIGDTIGQLLLYISLGVLVAGLLFAFKIFMLQLELGLIALLAPLSFAFLGLSTLKDQGIAPFKSLLSFAYRVIILTVILSAFGQVNDAVVNALSGVTASDIIANGIGNIVDTILAAMGAYLLLAFLVWKSDAVASSMASGSTSLGNSDIASAAAAGAAAGAVIGAAGSAAAGGAANAPQSMANFMSGLNGGGSVKNAGGVGSGGQSPAPFVPPTPAASMSRSGSAGGTSGSGASSGSAPSGASTSSSASKNAMPTKSQGGPGTAGSVASGRYGAEAPGANSTTDSAGNQNQLSEQGTQGGEQSQSHSAGNDDAQINGQVDAGAENGVRNSASSEVAASASSEVGSAPQSKTAAIDTAASSRAGKGQSNTSQSPSNGAGKSASTHKATSAGQGTSMSPTNKPTLGSPQGSALPMEAKSAAGSQMQGPSSSNSAVGSSSAKKVAAPASPASGTPSSVPAPATSIDGAGATQAQAQGPGSSNSAVGSSSAPKGADTAPPASGAPGSVPAPATTIGSDGATQSQAQTSAQGSSSERSAPQSVASSSEGNEMSVSPAAGSGMGAGTGYTSSGTPKSFDGATPKQAASSTNDANKVAADSTAGNASTAAISSNDKMQQSLDQIAQSLANQGPKKPSLKDHLGEANRQVERESDTTHVHISTHHSD